MTVLLISPFINPEAVGEPRWCYELAKAVSSRVETVIVTQSPRKYDFKVAELFPGVQVYEHKPWELDILPRRVHALFKPNYLRFYHEASKVISSQLDLKPIRCAHHFGPLALRYPTPLHRAGIPYAIGPLGGSLPTPAGFGSGNGGQPWYYRLRDLDRLRFRYDPWLRSSYQNAECVVGVADYVRDVLSPMKLRRFACFPEVTALAPDKRVREALAQRRLHEGPARFLIVSRLIFSKGIQYALKAAATLDRDRDWRIDIVGDGPMRAELEAMLDSLSLRDRVTLHGFVPRERVDDFYRDADIFLFPSIREPSGAVVFEAMSWGLPMISAAYGGPEAHVDDSFGQRVGVASQAGFIEGLRVAMKELLSSGERRAAMGEAAIEAAETRHSPAAMADFFLKLYESIGRT